MKKTLVALAVAAIATSASAATVYNNDGTQVDVGGRFDVVLGKFSDEQRTDLRNNESRIEFKAQHDLGDGFKAIGYTRLRFDQGDVFDSEDDDQTKSTFSTIKTNKLWLALEKDTVGRVSFGKQDTTGDAVQLNDNAYFLGGNNNLFTGGDKVVSFRTADFQLAEGQTLGFGVDYAFGQAQKDKGYTLPLIYTFDTMTGKYEIAPDLKNAYGVSAFYGAKFSDVTLNFNAGYTVTNYDDFDGTSGATGPQEKAWRVASQFGFAGAKFGAEYGQTLVKFANENIGKTRNVLVAAEYQVLPQSKVFAQWQRNSAKDTTGTKASYLGTVYLVGADYEFTKNVVTYVQYGRANNKVSLANVAPEKFNENRYGVGLRVYF